MSPSMSPQPPMGNNGYNYPGNPGGYSPQPMASPAPAGFPPNGGYPGGYPNPTGENNSGEKSRKKLLIISCILAIVLIFSCIGGLWIFRKQQAENAAWQAAHQYQAVKIDVTGSDYTPEKATFVPIRVQGTDLDKKKVDKRIKFYPKRTKVKLLRGSYTLKVEASPIQNDGRIYNIPKNEFHIKVTPPEKKDAPASTPESEETSGAPESSDTQEPSEAPESSDSQENSEAPESPDTENNSEECTSCSAPQLNIPLEPIEPENVTDEQLEQLKKVYGEYGMKDEEITKQVEVVTDARQAKKDEIAMAEAEEQARQEEAARQAAAAQAAREAAARAQRQQAQEPPQEPEGCNQCAKPIIYLYPTKKTKVNVKLKLSSDLGELTTTYPKYPAKGGWKVTANPNGLLSGYGNTYNYLYWEGVCEKFPWDFSHGFVVKGSDSAKFLEKSLPKLGLNRREANEFIVYWLPKMEANKWNLVSFQGKKYTDNAKLQVSPKPKTTIRVYMAFKALDKPIKVKPQTLKAPKRSGFTVIEWGGTEVKK